MFGRTVDDHGFRGIYQKALRQFCDYITDPYYGWPAECEDRFGTHPVQVCTEWNTGRHVQEVLGRPGKRALTHVDEDQDGERRPAGPERWWADARLR
ncbi:hypothetical protein E1292_19390 [Nonomuraea deserti]|uniref:Uncharacterized protein n=1 Tax=Nonomuraea deserti TaxID=1848322 RepID=A0A4V6PCM3_9ACTN|nr:hypothetical protein [Nonomuraea deserti]TDD04306.1 hypothetical protein E1292_19390 [Nonomuraea deserti]